jgi:hypothetical protein
MGSSVDHRNVREQQQEGRAAGKPKSSRALASRREGGGFLRRQDRSRSLPNGWPSLLTASEIAIDLPRKPAYAMAERTQLPRVTRVGRRLLVRRDDLPLSLDESRAARAGGAIAFSLADDSADLTAAPSGRF